MLVQIKNHAPTDEQSVVVQTKNGDFILKEVDGGLHITEFSNIRSIFVEPISSNSLIVTSKRKKK